MQQIKKIYNVYRQGLQFTTIANPRIQHIQDFQKRVPNSGGIGNPCAGVCRCSPQMLKKV